MKPISKVMVPKLSVKERIAHQVKAKTVLFQQGKHQKSGSSFKSSALGVSDVVKGF